MSIVDLAGGIEDVVEPIVVPGGEEYQLRIISCDMKLNKHDMPYILPRFEIVGEPLSKELSRYFGLPHDSMDEKNLNKTKLSLSRFFEALNFVPGSEFDTEDLIGLECWALLGIEESEEYGASNVVKRFITAK